MYSRYRHGFECIDENLFLCDRGCYEKFIVEYRRIEGSSGGFNLKSCGKFDG